MILSCQTDILRAVSMDRQNNDRWHFRYQIETPIIRCGRIVCVCCFSFRNWNRNSNCHFSFWTISVFFLQHTQNGYYKTRMCTPSNNSTLIFSNKRAVMQSSKKNEREFQFWFLKSFVHFWKFHTRKIHSNDYQLCAIAVFTHRFRDFFFVCDYCVCMFICSLCGEILTNNLWISEMTIQYI